MDVEGGELLVLEGMKNLLAAGNASRIICEVSKWGDKIRALMKKNGYALYLLDERGVAHKHPDTPELKGKNLLFLKK